MREQVTVRSFAEQNWQTMPEHRELFYKELFSSSEAEELGVSVSGVLRERIEPGGAVLPHTHDVAEVIHFIEGSVRVLVGEEWKNCAPGDTLIVPRGMPHSVENHGESPSHQISMFLPVVTGLGFTTFLTDVPRAEAEVRDGTETS